MKNWNKLLLETSIRADKPNKPQVIAKAVSDEIDDDAIISGDFGTNTAWVARFIDIREGIKFSVSVL